MVADSIREALRIGREGGVPVHISHHKVAGRQNWGRITETLELIRRARHDGLDVTLDGKPSRMEYYVARQATGGATVAGRLSVADIAELRADVESIARSITFPVTGIPGVVPIIGK